MKLNDNQISTKVDIPLLSLRFYLLSVLKNYQNKLFYYSGNIIVVDQPFIFTHRTVVTQ